MLNSIFDGTSIPLLEKVAIFGERRQQVLANNIANIDTPNFKRRDLPIAAFQRALRDAVSMRNSTSALTGAGASDSVSARFGSELFQPIEAPSPSITFQDNNNRSIEHEMMEMSKNALLQGFAIEVMNAQMGMLQAAIRGQV